MERRRGIVGERLRGMVGERRRVWWGEKEGYGAEHVLGIKLSKLFLS